MSKLYDVLVCGATCALLSIVGGWDWGVVLCVEARPVCTLIMSAFSSLQPTYRRISKPVWNSFKYSKTFAGPKILSIAKVVN